MPNFFSILGGFTEGGSVESGASLTVEQRATEAQRRHAAILNRITKEILASDDAVKIIRDDLADLAYKYIHQELSYLGVDIPMNLDTTNPDHAIVISTRLDILDSRNRLDNLLKTRSDERYWSKYLNEIGSPSIPNIPPLPQLFGAGAIIVVGIVLLLVFMRK